MVKNHKHRYKNKISEGSKILFVRDLDTKIKFEGVQMTHPSFTCSSAIVGHLIYFKNNKNDVCFSYYGSPKLLVICFL